MSTPSKRVFVSYSHKDSKWVDELKTFLAPWVRDKRLGLWTDQQIGVGLDWRMRIENEISQARVAVLLVTADFLASEFISDSELPVILDRAHKNQLTVIWIAVGHAAYQVTELAKFQAANDPRRPLESLRKPERDKVLLSIAQKVADAATLRTLAGGLQIVDETTEPLEAAINHRHENPNQTFSVQARYIPEHEQIAFTGTVTTITADDLSCLPPHDREFIADLEDSLERNYKRWSAVRRGLGDAGGALDDEVERQLTRVAKLMCQDLTSILNFLRQMHKFELEDHYARYRFICSRLQGV